MRRSGTTQPHSRRCARTQALPRTYPFWWQLLPDKLGSRLPAAILSPPSSVDPMTTCSRRSLGCSIAATITPVTFGGVVRRRLCVGHSFWPPQRPEQTALAQAAMLMTQDKLQARCTTHCCPTSPQLHGCRMDWAGDCATASILSPAAFAKLLKIVCIFQKMTLAENIIIGAYAGKFSR